MEIQFFGNSCFKIRGSRASLITDPFEPNGDLKLPKVGADIITLSREERNYKNISAVLGTTRRSEPFVISGPGEYEISNVYVLGLPSAMKTKTNGGKKSTIYVINIDGMRIVHLGLLDHKLTEDQLEEINSADILFIPVGGVLVFNAKEAIEVIGKTEPKIIIPMCFKLPGVNIGFSSVDEFLKEIGKKEILPMSKFLISKENLPEEQQIVVLATK